VPIRRLMRIVFLSPRFYPQIGGVEKHAFEVAKRLAEQHRVVVITEGVKDKKENFNGIKVIRLYFGKNDWFKKFIIWGKILKHRKIIEKADIVHCHDVFFWYLPLRIIYPNKKVFTTFHGYEAIFPPSSKAIFIRKLSEKLSNGNIAIGEYIRKWYGTTSEAIIYGAQDEAQARNTKFNKHKKLRILFVGRIEKDTGAEVYPQVLRKLKNYTFEACGDGTLRSELEKFGKVHGFVKDLTKYISKADIIFASSYLSIIAAIKLKKPVFSVFENPLKEDYLKLTPFNRWIYISKSPEILVKKIKIVVNKKRLREKNLNLAYNWANEQTWDKVSKIYLKLWGGRE